MTDPNHDTPRILQPGTNCWRLAHASRAAILIDGAAYFAALRAALARARRSVFIISWDVDSRIALLPGIEPDDGLPARLGDFLNALAERRKELHIHVLDWDFTMLYAMNREVLPIYQLGWRTHRRLHFHLDEHHPLGASHHQKIVVIDDALAFVGGLDLTRQRWDTPEHRPDEPRRVNGRGRPYPPFHDVQLAVDGAAATALGELARERWRRATGREPKVETGGGADPWPPELQADLNNVEVAIARTEPAYGPHPEVQEVKRLYLDAIAAARQSIYIENQYFTAAAIGAALAERLREPQGPEVVVVSRLSGGWLESNTLEVLRARLINDLQMADLHGRLRIYVPHHAGLAEPIKLHSKLMVVDGRLLRVGSANLNNRSMGLDTECDLAIEAAGPAAQQAIHACRDRLLAEHLGVTPERVSAEIIRAGSLIAAIDALRGNPRSLEPLALAAPAGLEAKLPSTALVDPERPLHPEWLVDELIPGETKARAHRRILMLAGVLLALGGLAAAWHFTPLSEWLDVQTLAYSAQWLKSAPGALLWVLAIYLLASLAAVPITVLVVATVLVFGPALGFAYALAGAMLAAALGFWLGQVLGRPAIRRLAGPRLNAISRRLGQSGLLAVLTVRVIPVAPFTVVNLVAGASHIRFRDFMLGTLLGLLPGLLALTVFSDRVLAALRNPSPLSLSLLAAALAAITAGAYVLRRWLKRNSSSLA